VVPHAGSCHQPDRSLPRPYKGVFESIYLYFHLPSIPPSSNRSRSRAPGHKPEAASNVYREDGLVKQSYSITTTSGRKLHIVSYFTKKDAASGRLRRVSKDPRFVGEGGGEWNLKIDKVEYRFSEVSNDSMLTSESPDFSGILETTESADEGQVQLTAVDQSRQRRKEEAERYSHTPESHSPQEFFHYYHASNDRPMEQSERSQASSPPGGRPTSSRQHLTTSSSWTQESFKNSNRFPYGPSMPSSPSLPSIYSNSANDWSGASDSNRIPSSSSSGSLKRTKLNDHEGTEASSSFSEQRRGTTITFRPPSLTFPQQGSSRNFGADRDGTEPGASQLHRCGSGSRFTRPQHLRTSSSSSQHFQSSRPRFEGSGFDLCRPQSSEDGSNVGRKRSADMELDLPSTSRSPSPISRNCRNTKPIKTLSGGSGPSSAASSLAGGLMTSFRSSTSTSTPLSSATQSAASLSPTMTSLNPHRFPARAGSEERWRTARENEREREREFSDHGSEHSSGLVGNSRGFRHLSPSLSVGSLNDLPSSSSSAHLDVTNSLLRLRTRSNSERDPPLLTRSPQDMNFINRSSNYGPIQPYSNSPTSSLGVSASKAVPRPFTSSQSASSLLPINVSGQRSMDQSPSRRDGPGFSPYSAPSRSASDNDVLSRLDTVFK